MLLLVNHEDDLFISIQKQATLFYGGEEILEMKLDPKEKYPEAPIVITLSKKVNHYGTLEFFTQIYSCETGRFIMPRIFLTEEKARKDFETREFL